MSARVLLVEDDALLRELLGLIVEKHGYVLRKVEDGLAAIDAMVSFQPDLVVLDVMMPVMDGRDFLAWLGQYEGRKPKILILTSANDSQLYRDLYDLGADKIATKPVSMKTLESEIDALLGHSLLGSRSKEKA